MSYFRSPAHAGVQDALPRVSIYRCWATAFAGVTE